MLQFLEKEDAEAEMERNKEKSGEMGEPKSKREEKPIKGKDSTCTVVLAMFLLSRDRRFLLMIHCGLLAHQRPLFMLNWTILRKYKFLPFF